MIGSANCRMRFLFPLSLMPLKEASQTSILSRRWRYLWTFTTGSLDFDGSALLSLLGIEKYWEKEKGRFVRWVNGVLRLHQGSTIDEFRACFVVSEKNFTLDIENWLSFSLRKKVKRFVLECKCLRNCDYQQYTLTDQFLCNYSLDSLTVLCLTHVQVTEKALEYVLSNCPFLEVLSMECSDSLWNLKPSGPLLKLKHLEITAVGLRNVAISASNLASFKYYGNVARILLGNVPNLVEASYAGLYAFFLLRHCDQMPSYLSQLETLSSDLTWQRFSRFSKFPILRNLRHLNLTLLAMDVKTLLGCTSLLVASPLLHRFVVELMGLELEDPAEEKKAVHKVEHQHQCLSVFELKGFVGCKVDTELVQYILKKAMSLRKVITTLCNYWNPEKKVSAITCARQLETRLPPGVELVIL